VAEPDDSDQSDDDPEREIQSLQGRIAGVPDHRDLDDEPDEQRDSGRECQ